MTILSIVGLFVTGFFNAQDDDGNGLTSGLSNLPTKQNSVLKVFFRLWSLIIAYSVGYFVSVTMYLCLVGVVALTWFSYRVAGQPFTDARTVVMQDIKATLELQSALHNVKRKTPLTWQGRLRSAKHGAKRRFVDTTVLKTVVEEKSLQLSGKRASGISVLESVVSTSKKKSNFLFSIIQLPEDILKSISFAIRIHKIPNSQVGKFVEDVANNLECLNEKEMKIQIDRLREKVGVL
ncbi:uncharacterized protein LOC119736776 [Patiria miniata]|uniref:Uncharacterized protein n=1 Tax=Patiria miniata TaxID=46514 RepID=A0A914ASW0_PATMI|nr:uncharacterized protein LOC119736776 [Patiria miniata]